MSTLDEDAITVRSALIIGGGIGGLASAIALRRSGIAVALVEKATAFGEVGAGLQLGPNAMRVLFSWGLEDAIREIAVFPDNLVARDAITDRELSRVTLDQAFEDRYGAPYAVIHRTDLHSLLLSEAVRLGADLSTATEVVSVDAAAGIAVTLDGRSLSADLVIGADGLRSSLRDALVGDRPINSGYVAYRGTIPIADGGPIANDVVVWMGPGGHLVQYPLRRGELLNNVLVFRSDSFARGESEYGGVDELEERFSGCHPVVARALDFVGKQRRWPLFDRMPSPIWADQRLVLMGDAAHPMLQYLAQGACQALEDAEALGRVAGHAGTAMDVGARFAAERSPRAAQVQTMARAFGELCHRSGSEAAERNEVLRSRAIDDFSAIDWLYAARGGARG
ncbi:MULTISPECIES: FAD-dependent monooxygenase [unclassified Microbacterium]|uniref:FAD-dependent monooxygenase n=1 Tax=unclassified Microbacterium TaxID=2609290 RepID=UPI000EA85701|nr:MULTISPECIES: FAD-dependent monooxygenase [unclassified Microbacterium]MBT2486473.1 FAD-dependent monooxygenase [Microbacterium sp. ISL-108]RKN69171.1 3-hydroxybenzoate 6-hydroxylase [Microbacterium sp. CGR2]